MWGLWPKTMSWALGPSEDTACPRRQHGLSNPHQILSWGISKMVRGGIPPRTLKIQSKRASKPLKPTPWIREKEGNTKYLSKSCHHHIECTTAIFLAALMWRRPLNSVTLAITTHKELKEVFNETDAQVEV